MAEDNIIKKVLVMSVEPGFGGQAYLPMSTKKIKDLANWRDENNYNFIIQVDGGINLNNIQTVVDAGATDIVIGSSIFKHRELEKVYNKKMDVDILINKNVLPMPAVSASVSCMDLGNLADSIKKVEDSDVAFFHYDVVDGRFNKCYILGDILCDYLKKNSRLPIEVHLAVYDIENYIEVFAQKKVEYIAVHYEAMKNPKEIFAKIRSLGAKPVLAYRADTEPKDDLIELAPLCEWILKLTVNPGFAGQKINPEAIKHIKMMSDMLKQNNIKTRIQADGNVNKNTTRMLAEAGATIFTGGTSGLFLTGKSIQENLRELLAPTKEFID